MYNKSIVFAPKRSVELSFAYANQSAVLFRLKKFKECQQAIESFLSLKNYPENSKLKIFFRKIECLCKLDRKIEAEKTYKETENWIKEKVSVEAQPEKLNQLKKSFKKEPVKQKIAVNIFDRVMEELNCSNSNKEVPALSDAVTLKYNEQFGRHLVAARNIKAGEFIGKEKPYSLTLVSTKMYSYCWNCATEVWNCFPCDHCVNVIFCSEKCRGEAWEMFHDVECEVFQDLKNMTAKHHEKLEATFFGGFQSTIKAIKEFGSLENLKQVTNEIDEYKGKETFFCIN